MSNHLIDKTINIILDNYNNRDLVVWGYCETSKKLAEKIKMSHGLDISYYVDKNPNLKGANNIYTPSHIKHKKDSIYLICILPYYSEIEESLSQWNYTPKVDHTYLTHKPIKVTNIQNYQDKYGNKIIGDTKNAIITFHGQNSILTIGVNFNPSKNVTIELLDDSTVEIGNNVTIKKNTNWHHRSMSYCRIGNNCSFSKDGIIRCGEGASIEIESNNVYGSNYRIVSLLNTKISIGEDCIFSHDILIRSNDGHSIFDIKTKKNINSDPIDNFNRNVFIGNHVWVGAKTIIMYNSNIGSGSIIGAGSFVKKHYPNNCIIAGSPAKIIRKDIAWSRRNFATDISIIDEQYINMTDI